MTPARHPGSPITFNHPLPLINRSANRVFIKSTKRNVHLVKRKVTPFVMVKLGNFGYTC